MNPGHVGLTIGALLVLTTANYYFVIPENIRQTGNSSGNWGKPDAEFDWCESNYLISPWVAEPWNTVTSVLYVLFAFGTWQLHTNISMVNNLNLVLVAMIGAGSVLFHASLRYKMQLMDELPMYWLILVASYGLLMRSGSSEYAASLPWALGTWGISLAAVLLLTDREQQVHNIGRGLMAVSFACCFCYIFVACAKASNEVDTGRIVTEHRKNVASFLMQRAFYCFVFALVCWLVDNACCNNILLHLPVYPQLHSLWHLGTAVGLYYLFVLLHLHDLVVQKKTGATIEFMFDTVPYVAEAAHTKMLRKAYRSPSRAHSPAKDE